MEEILNPTVEIVNDEPAPILAVIPTAEVIKNEKPIYKKTGLSVTIKIFLVLSIISIVLLGAYELGMGLVISYAALSVLAYIALIPFLLLIVFVAALCGFGGSGSLDALRIENTLGQIEALEKLFPIVFAILVPSIIAYITLSICGFVKERKRYKS